MEGNKYLAAIAAYPKINTAIWQKIFAYFPDMQTAWEASAKELLDAGIAISALEGFNTHRKQTNPEKEQEKLERYGINIILFPDRKYPKNLKEIYNPPFVLFVRGELLERDENAIAVVGSRRATDYGKRVTREITEELAKAGITVVSGLALGLDAEAHWATVNQNQRAIAVLANGLDQIYPRSNDALGKRILENGAIISERPIGMPPLRQNFPARNRIISGLSLGVLVTEAGDKSGTLHTANFALEQGRNVYAVPGPIYNPLSYGPNMLIKNGAKPVTCAADILEDYGIEATVTEKALPENENERLIFAILETEPKHIDVITRESGKEANEISQILSMMEIKGKVKQIGGMVYTLR